MISYKERTKRFNIDRLQFSDYGSALSKLLYDRLPHYMHIELSSTSNVPVVGKEPIQLAQYTFDAELDKQDIRDLGFIAQGLMPQEHTLFDKVLTIIYNQIHSEVKYLCENGTPRDMQKLVFWAVPGGYPIVAAVRDNTVSITVAFKVVANDEAN